MERSLIVLLIAGLLASLCGAQQAGWIAGQVNTTMCYWQGLRAAVIRDTLYIDGGYLWWEPGLSDGTYGSPINDGNPLGLVYLLNFSTPFNTNSNFTKIFTTASKAAGGGNANNIGPLYYDGGMFANDYEWFTYGGLLSLTDAYPTPSENSVAVYDVYASGPPKQFTSGYILDQLPTGVTRYVTDGAAVSVPSENLGFYFGGLRSASSGPIYYNPSSRNASLNADTLSTTLIKLDMAVQLKETWSNFSLPTDVPGRANAQVVWVPYSEQGLLVAIGGVIFPAYAKTSQTDNATETAASKAQSPKFMSTVAVYDVYREVWYEQETTGAPGQLTQGCAVAASAQDGSSHNIYWYGGFDGLNLAGPFSDDVWVLSIPSFIWIKVKSGDPARGRAGHTCTMPYPDQMLVVGGYAALSGTTPSCVPGGLIRIFNLTKNDWVEDYSPKVWSNYTVPSVIYSKIGGTGTGSATQTAPSPSGFANSTLKNIFGDTYNTSKITTWYPYAEASQTPSTNRTILPSVVPKPGGTPKYLAPVLGVILGLVFITCLVVAIMLYRRRKVLKVSGTGTQSENGTVDNRRWVTSWLRTADAKALTVTTDETPISPSEEDGPYMPPEIGGGQVHEMMDTSRPQELQSTASPNSHPTGFHPLPIPLASISRQPSDRGSQSAAGGLHSSPSAASQTSSVSHISPPSSPSPPDPSPVRRADSPVLPLSTGAPSPSPLQRPGFTSGVSALSESDRGHLRGISETSAISGESAQGQGDVFVTPPLDAGLPKEGARGMVSPITPPQQKEGVDYISARGGGGGSKGAGSPSTKRRSNFSEELDDEMR